MKFALIADVFFEDKFLGGGEINNFELTKLLEKFDKCHDVSRIRCNEIDQYERSFLLKRKLIVSNFITLNDKDKEFITNECDYIIYEHDHKYLKNRDPSPFKDFKAPPEQIINKKFYQNAKKVFCQSKIHAEVVRKNLKLDNIVNLSGNLWSEDSLNLLEKYSTVEKTKKASIMMSNNPVKNSIFSIDYCNAKNIPYELIPLMEPKDFLSSLSKNECLVFFPTVLETLSRIVLEARMMNCKIITNNLVGAASEDWFNLKGSELIELMRKRREEIPNLVFESFGA
jgi:hypothetical protein